MYNIGSNKIFDDFDYLNVINNLRNLNSFLHHKLNFNSHAKLDPGDCSEFLIQLDTSDQENKCLPNNPKSHNPRPVIQNIQTDHELMNTNYLQAYTQNDIFQGRNNEEME